MRGQSRGRGPNPCSGSITDSIKNEGGSIAESGKKRGRGRPPTGIGPSIGLRLYAEQEAKLDAWIEAQPDPKPSKPEAIRRLLGEALSALA